MRFMALVLSLPSAPPRRFSSHAALATIDVVNHKALEKTNPGRIVGPGRRNRRLVVALTAVVLLVGALVYTTFSASSEARTPSELLRSAEPGRSYELTGRVVAGYRRRGDELLFRVRDRAGSGSVPVRYTGAVPDPFRAGREVIVTVRREGGGFVGERDSLVTKCPSKFSTDRS
jgi:cytochrome c-type biogenesis protein CcmE